MKESFYEYLDVLSSVSSTNKLILLGEFNARVGCDSVTLILLSTVDGIHV